MELLKLFLASFLVGKCPRGVNKYNLRVPNSFVFGTKKLSETVAFSAMVVYVHFCHAIQNQHCELDDRSELINDSLETIKYSYSIIR